MVKCLKDAKMDHAGELCEDLFCCHTEDIELIMDLKTTSSLQELKWTKNVFMKKLKSYQAAILLNYCF